MVSPAEVVTVVVTRRIKPGAEPAYEAWVRDVGEVVGRFPGHLGLALHRPRAPDEPWTLVYRFDTGVHLDAWMTSPERAQWVARADALAEDGHTHAAFTGMEPFFALPGVAAPTPPPKWKMALVTFSVVFPTAQVLGALASLSAPAAPALARAVVVSAVMVVLLTWVIMPRLTRLLARWLFAPPR